VRALGGLGHEFDPPTKLRGKPMRISMIGAAFAVAAMMSLSGMGQSGAALA
jgi:hypothetical protein